MANGFFRVWRATSRSPIFWLVDIGWRTFFLTNCQNGFSSNWRLAHARAHTTVAHGTAAAGQKKKKPPVERTEFRRVPAWQILHCTRPRTHTCTRTQKHTHTWLCGVNRIRRIHTRSQCRARAVCARRALCLFKCNLFDSFVLCAPHVK